MSREEDLIRSTTRAIASTIREVPPLQLESATEELGSLARAPRSRRGGPRRWWSWGAPLAAAAVVVALAIALVLIKGIQNDSAVPSDPATSTGLGGVPRYYVALKQLAGDLNSSTQRNDIVVGDSLTGKTLATFPAPAHTAFESVTAAADDRTFVVFGVTSSNGSFGNLSAKGATMTGSWWEVRLAPGTAHPARLTRLPIKPVAASSTGVDAFYEFIDSFGSVLSGSGTELAVPVSSGTHGFAVKVFSVATGRLLHDWTTTNWSVVEEPSVSWIDGDRELALVSRNQIMPTKFPGYATSDVTVREWPVAGPASGDLLADSKVVWHVQTLKNPLTTVQLCTEPVVGGPIVISPDGKTFSCTTAGGWGPTDHLSFHTYPLTPSTTATAQGTIDYEVMYTNAGRYNPEVLWSSPSGDTLIGALFPYTGGPPPIANGLHIGVISHGKFTPLRIPASLAASTVAHIAF
jgi:hypothetical protein